MKNNLPTDDLKKYGIIGDDHSFNSKLSESDVQKFLNGHIIIVDNANDRVTFQLLNNNSKLDVNFFKREKEIDLLLENAKTQIQYSEIKNTLDENNPLNYEKKAFIYDEANEKVIELDFIKNSTELVKIFAEKENAVESNRFKIELLKMKDFLQDKIDKFPEIAKEITNNMNIVSKTISSIDGIAMNERMEQKQQQTVVRYDVNDADLYQDANREREEEAKEEQNITKSRLKR